MSIAATPTFPSQFVLAGPARVRDPRVTPVRGDLADIALAGRVFVPHYVVPVEAAVAPASAAMRKQPHNSAEQTSELLRGERFAVLDIAGGWAWGYGVHDGYLGYLAAAALTDPETVPAPAEPDATAPAASAESLVGTPYVWGGRGGEGLDCSGLVQTVFARAGHRLPRDSDQQAADAGRPLVDGETPERGDLVFFPGHVGILKDQATLIHASNERGRVVAEPLADVIAARGPATVLRRVQ